MPPLGDLDRVHLVLRAQLTQCLLAAQRLDSYSRCELWAVGFSRRCHQPLLVNDAVRILAYCLVQSPGSTIIFTILPALRSTICGSTALVQWNTPLRLVS